MVAKAMPRSRRILRHSGEVFTLPPVLSEVKSSNFGGRDVRGRKVGIVAYVVTGASGDGGATASGVGGSIT